MSPQPVASAVSAGAVLPFSAGNLLHDALPALIAADTTPEQILPLWESGTVHTAQRGRLRVERIVSWGQHSAPDFAYDQDEDEWVLLLSGQACLQFADENEARQLQAGDYLYIAAHRRHRVTWTAPNTATVWLAVFFPPSPQGLPEQVHHDQQHCP